MNESTSVSTRAWRQYVGHVAWRTVGLALFVLLLLVGSSTLAQLGHLSFWWAIPLNTIAIYLLFTPAHEAAHGNIKGRAMGYKWLEDAVGWVSSMSFTAPLPMFRRIHLIHHTHTNDPHEDPDYWVADRRLWMVILRCFTVMGDYYYHYFRRTKELLASPHTRREWWQSIAGLVIAYAAVIGWGLTAGWVYPLLLWLLPALLATAFLAFVFDYLPHHPHSIQQRYLDTRIILFPGLSTLLVSQNMHLIHHLYPGIPYYHYGDTFELLEEELRDKGANIEDWSGAR